MTCVQIEDFEDLLDISEEDVMLLESSDQCFIYLAIQDMHTEGKQIPYEDGLKKTFPSKELFDEMITRWPAYVSFLVNFKSLENHIPKLADWIMKISKPIKISGIEKMIENVPTSVSYYTQIGPIENATIEYIFFNSNSFEYKLCRIFDGPRSKDILDYISRLKMLRVYLLKLNLSIEIFDAICYFGIMRTRV